MKTINGSELVRTTEPATEPRGGHAATASCEQAEVEPVLNAELLATQTHGDKELEAELAQLFRVESPRLMKRLRDAFAGGDTDAIRQAAHRMKGSLSTLGAVRAAGTAALIEASAIRGEAAEAAALETIIEAQLGELDLALEDLLTAPSTA